MSGGTHAAPLPCGPTSDPAKKSAMLGKLSAPSVINFAPVGSWYWEHVETLDRNRMPSFTEVNHQFEDLLIGDAPKKEQKDEDAPDDYVDIGDGEWKNQDHYNLLGLGHLRWRANEEDIKRAYKKSVLKYHPDKKAQPTPDEDTSKSDAQFVCVQKAFEILSDPAKRRLYDSVDDFDEEIPAVNKESKENFFKVFSPVVLSNSRWFTKQPAPLLGDDNTSYEDVMSFYDYWYNTESWRVFGYFDEQDPSQASSREEKRWMIRQNQTERKKQKKQENARMIKLVDSIFACDPRIKKFKQQEKDEKEQAKKAKEEAKKAEVEKKKEAQRQAELEQKARELEEKKKKDEEKASLLAAKRSIVARSEKLKYFIEDDAKYSFERETMKVRVTSYSQSLQRQKISDLMSLDDASFQTQVLDDLNVLALKAQGISVPTQQQLQQQQQQQQQTLSRAQQKKEEPQEPVEWTKDELKMLNKAAKELPVGTRDRYEKIAEYLQIHGRTTYRRTSKDVVARIKSMQNYSETSKSKANENAFESFVASKSKDRSVPAESVPSERTDEATAEKVWSVEEQKLLESALRTVAKDDPERWSKIAELIPGRTKQDCVKRCKELRDKLQAKKGSS